MSTTTLHAAVDTATTTATLRVARALTSLDGYGILTLATADSLLANLAAAEEHTDDDKALAQVAMDAGLRAHSLLMVVKAALLALADVGDTGQLDQALVDAIVAADPVVTESVRTALHNSITAPGDCRTGLRPARRAAARSAGRNRHHPGAGHAAGRLDRRRLAVKAILRDNGACQDLLFTGSDRRKCLRRLQSGFDNG